jgi:hypothetical protein
MGSASPTAGLQQHGEGDSAVCALQDFELAGWCSLSFGSLIEQIVSSSKAASVGYCLNIPYKNVRHFMRLAIALQYKDLI